MSRAVPSEPEIDLTALYEVDFYLWTQTAADRLRSVQPEALDWDHLAEEVADLGKRDRREVWRRTRVILLHLLKWDHQPALRSTSWRSSILTQRTELRSVFLQSPSLRRAVQEALETEYAAARSTAADQTGLPPEVFPKTCPYTAEQVMEREIPFVTFDTPAGDDTVETNED